MLKIERESTDLHSVKNWLWKRLWTSHKTDYIMKLILKTFLCQMKLPVNSRAVFNRYKFKRLF
jgi:hypothetical protein